MIPPQLVLGLARREGLVANLFAQLDFYSDIILAKQRAKLTTKQRNLRGREGSLCWCIEQEEEGAIYRQMGAEEGGRAA